MKRISEDPGAGILTGVLVLGFLALYHSVGVMPAGRRGPWFGLDDNPVFYWVLLGVGVAGGLLVLALSLRELFRR